jgi:ribonucleoside-diphosphate reductase beta chain
MLEPDENRESLKPIKHKDIWNFYKRNLQSIWFVEEVSLVEDIKQWPSIDPKIKLFLKHILAFFSGADLLVATNCQTNFAVEIPYLEAAMFYRFQAFSEDIHSDMYTTLIDSFITDPIEKEKIFKAVTNMPVIKQKTDWMKKYMERESNSLQKRLVAFAISEGLFFCSSFASIFYIRDLGLMPGLSLSNDFISRDESQHCLFACLMYKKFKKKLNQDEINEIFTDAVKIESNFVVESIPVSLIGLNAKLMIEYVKYVADFWIVELGYKKLFFAKNPFSFMQSINLTRKTNFFEKHSAEYSKLHDNMDQALSFNNDDEYF